MDCSPRGSSVYGISQARILEWVAISYSRGSSRPRNRTHVSCIGRRVLYHWPTWEVQCSWVQFFSFSFFFFRKTEKLTGKVCWGNTATFNRMVRQWFTDKMTFEPLPKGREVSSCRKEEHSKWRKQQRFQNGNTVWAWRTSGMWWVMSSTGSSWVTLLYFSL